MAQKNIVHAIALDTLPASLFSSSYDVVNSTTLTNACFLLRIQNDTNRDVTISYDGITDHDWVKENESLQISSQNNALPSSHTLLFAKGTTVYIKAASPGTGNLYISAYYQVQN